jgi:hypothetical protein
LNLWKTVFCSRRSLLFGISRGYFPAQDPNWQLSSSSLLSYSARCQVFHLLLLLLLLSSSFFLLLKSISSFCQALHTYFDAVGTKVSFLGEKRKERESVHSSFRTEMSVRQYWCISILVQWIHTSRNSCLWVANFMEQDLWKGNNYSDSPAICYPSHKNHPFERILSRFSSV